jgi:uncharacterized glyoxalase superfamily protein PhnB
MKGLNLAHFGGNPVGCRREHPDFTAFIKVDDVGAVYERVVASGTATDGPPQDQPWGGRTFSLVDLNGFHLTFYQLVRREEADRV